MNVSEVESLLRDVIVHVGLPYTVLSVIGSPAGWTIMVRARTARIVRFAVPDGRPIAVRSAIQETLAAQRLVAGPVQHPPGDRV